MSSLLLDPIGICPMIALQGGAFAPAGGRRLRRRLRAKSTTRILTAIFAYPDGAWKRLLAMLEQAASARHYYRLLGSVCHPAKLDSMIARKPW